MEEKNKDKQNKLSEIALFRFSLIAPLVNDTYEAPSKMQFYRDIACKTHVLPNGKSIRLAASTLKKWYIRYMIRWDRCYYS